MKNLEKTQKTRCGKLRYYKDEKGEYRWRLKSKNGRIVAESGEGYNRIEMAVKGFSVVKELLRNDDFFDTKMEPDQRIK